MINLKNYLVGIGFILVLAFFLIQKIRTHQDKKELKKRIKKNRKKKNLKK